MPSQTTSSLLLIFIKLKNKLRYTQRPFVGFTTIKSKPPPAPLSHCRHGVRAIRIGHCQKTDKIL